MPNIRFPVIKAHQNIGDLYVGVMSAHDLYAMAEADRIRLESLTIPKYAGFQRALVGKRVAEIEDYLTTERATFPNAIIVSLDSEFVERWDDVEAAAGVSLLEVRREGGAMTIIDGQHRVAALEGVDERFQVIVSLFIDLEMMREAEVFAKINSTQKVVNPSIAFQLFGYSEDRSPQRTAHDIAQTLNTTKGSPFYKGLRMLGSRDAWSNRSLSQSTFAKELMRLYTGSWTRDEYRLMRKEKLEPDTRYPLRELFIKGRDSDILEIVWQYFLNVAETWPDQWRDRAGDSILTKTTGYSAFMRVLRIWLRSERAEEVKRNRGVREAFAAIRATYERADRRFIRDNYPAGNQGIIKLRDLLLRDLNLE